MRCILGLCCTPFVSVKLGWEPERYGKSKTGVTVPLPPLYPSEGRHSE